MVPALGALTAALAVACLAVSAWGVRLSIRLARLAGVLDMPNVRSSHAVPTPRIGGVPMAAAVLLAFACWRLLSEAGASSPDLLPGAILFALAMSALGFWDDVSGLSPLFRFLVQVVCAAAVLWTSARVAAPPPVREAALPLALGVAAAAIWVVWLVNLYNFMDGIDGLAGGEALLASCFFALVFGRHGETGWAAANLFVAAASLGFLLYNWPPARVFMGDAGSAFLGAFFAMQSVLAPLSTPVPFPVLVLPFANFILDTTATLLRRMWRREKWYLAHRSHFYQRMTSLGMSHRGVTGTELLSVAASCAAAWGYMDAGPAGRFAIVAAVVAAFAAAGSVVARKERERESRKRAAD